MYSFIQQNENRKLKMTIVSSGPPEEGDGDFQIQVTVKLNIGIIHVFSCIYNCRGSRKLFEPKAARLSFS